MLGDGSVLNGLGRALVFSSLSQMHHVFFCISSGALLRGRHDWTLISADSFAERTSSALPSYIVQRRYAL